jgi:hypothetical protein
MDGHPGVNRKHNFCRFMRLQQKIVIFLLLTCSLLTGVSTDAGDKVFFREDFETLDAWEPLYFRGVDRHTTYAVEKQGDTNILVAKSRRSASALVCKRTFDVTEFPIIRWRWQVDRLYAKGNYRHRSGDDYPIRVYVLFAFDPETAPIGMKIQYALVRSLYGRYPPHSTLNYIWANHPNETAPVASPFTDRSIMIPLQHGPRKVGQWVQETVNVLEDYRRFFGEDPPRQAALAVMNDSDNTGAGSTSYLQFIEVRKIE